MKRFFKRIKFLIREGFIARLIRWIPIIWKDRDWDFAYVYIVEQHKLKMLKRYRPDYAPDYQYLNTAIKLLDIIINEQYKDIYKVNIRNYKRFEPMWTDADFQTNLHTTFGEVIDYSEYRREDLAIQKAINAYELIRKRYLRTWWV